MKTVDPSDSEILARISNGEREMYRLIMERYGSLVFNVAGKYETDKNQIVERAHEIFVKAYERLGSFRGKSAFSSWLYRLANNHCLDAYRRRKHRNAFFTDFPEEQVIDLKDDNPGPDADAEATLDAGSDTAGPSVQFWEALTRINDTYSVPLLMKYRDGLSYEEISRNLNVPVGALKVRVHRARKELKSMMEEML